MTTTELREREDERLGLAALADETAEDVELVRRPRYAEQRIRAAGMAHLRARLLLDRARTEGEAHARRRELELLALG